MTEAVKIAHQALDDKFGKDIVVLDISKVSVMADYFIIATGSNSNQADAMADEVTNRLYKAGKNVRHTEGSGSTKWILLDFDDIIVHIFDEETRGFYNLERVWGDATVVDLSTAQKIPD